MSGTPCEGRTEVLALCGQVWYSSRRRSEPCGRVFCRAPIASIRRF